MIMLIYLPVFELKYIGKSLAAFSVGVGVRGSPLVSNPVLEFHQQASSDLKDKLRSSDVQRNSWSRSPAPACQKDPVKVVGMCNRRFTSTSNWEETPG